MKLAIYKLEFKAGVHFGSGALSSSNSFFLADTLFSALYIEAIKLGLSDSFLSSTVNGDILFSDAFPYIGETYFLPKPNIYIEPGDKGDSKIKKGYKKMKYIPAQLFDDYIAARIDPDKCSISDLGKEYDHVMASVSMEEDDTKPYSVGTFFFSSGNGLYIIAEFKGDEDKYLFEELMESLSYSGIGGKRSAGKGRFVFKYAKGTEMIMEMMKQKTGRYMLLSTALPKTEELERALVNASYLLQRRSGFVYSDDYADTTIKKLDLYTMQAGSCFSQTFGGDVYDVSGGKGIHPVYRYAKGMFMEV